MDYKAKGKAFREEIKALVFDFIKNSPEGERFAQGIKQAEIFRSCGLDWGEYPNATSSNQQYWVVALLRELEAEGKVCRDPDTKAWRIKS